MTHSQPLRPYRPAALLVVLIVLGVLTLVGPPLALAAPTAQDCAVCHSVPSGHASLHYPPGPISGTILLFDGDHEQAGTGISVTVDCSMCHDVRDIAALHGNSCALCHGETKPRESFEKWNGGCQQGDCHRTYHDDTFGGHAAAMESGVSGGGCDCHDAYTWNAGADNCGACHSMTDVQAPVTTSDARAAYVGPATILLSPSDAPDPGGSGVAKTFYKLDGAAAAEGTRIAITPPETGIESHILEFWSVDGAGNEEIARIAAFTVAADTTPPSTTSNAVEQYDGVAEILLTAIDDGTVPPTTYYILDGEPVRTGTEISVPPPTNGSATHTLEFWSVDSSGNQETPRKSVTFTIIRDLEPPSTTTDAKAFYRAGVWSVIKLTATDSGSGVDATYYRYNGTAPVAGTGLSISSFRLGVHTLEYWSVDRAGNTEPAKTVTFTVDGTPPTTTSDARSVYTDRAAIRLSASDNTGGSGVGGTYYKLDGGAQRSGEVIEVDTSGSHVLEFWSVDAVGNTETRKTVSFTVVGSESVPPETSSDALETYDGPATIRLTAVDEPGGSGVRATYYRLDGAPQVEGTTVNVSAVGSHTLEFWSVDNSGNEETPHKSVQFSITGATQTGSIEFAWNDPPDGSWTYYYVYDAAGRLVDSSYNTTGWYTSTVPVSTRAYQLKAYWLDTDNESYPIWSYGTALVDTSGKVVRWWY